MEKALLAFAVTMLLACIAVPVIGYIANRKAKRQPAPPILSNNVDEWV